MRNISCIRVDTARAFRAREFQSELATVYCTTVAICRGRDGEVASALAAGS